MSEVVQRRTQEERKAESEQKIIAAAIELFAAQGYLKTTLSQVGKKAGYSGGLISNRYGSKENLLKLVLQAISKGFLHVQIAGLIDADDFRGSIHRFIQSYLTSVENEIGSIRALYTIMGETLGGVPEVQPDIARFNEQTREYIARMVRTGVKTHQISRKVKPEAASLVILALIRGMTMQYLADPSAYSMKSIIKHVNSAIDAYIGEPPTQ